MGRRLLLAIAVLALAVGPVPVRGEDEQPAEPSRIPEHRDDPAGCDGCHEAEATAPHRHPRLRQEGCVARCHDPALPERLSAAAASVCSASCHVGFHESWARPHPLVSGGDCLGCHDPHGVGRPGLLRGASDEQLCMTCHDDLRQGGPDAHAPTVGGMCLLCHGGHSVTAPDALGYERPPPCQTCHADVLPAEHQPHSATEVYGCSGCHDPHWGSEPAQLRPAGRIRARCFLCHEDDAQGLLELQPVDHGDCDRCHAPHGSDHAANLRQDRWTTCTECHAEVGQDVEVPHPAMELPCTAVCHDAHVSRLPGFLQMDNVQTCTTCHVGSDGAHVGMSVAGKPHPIDTVDDPLRAGRTLDCTACHDPHGSMNPDLYRFARTRGELCAQCHTGTPSAPNPRFVQEMERRGIAWPGAPQEQPDDPGETP